MTTEDEQATAIRQMVQEALSHEFVVHSDNPSELSQQVIAFVNHLRYKDGYRDDPFISKYPAVLRVLADNSLLPPDFSAEDMESKIIAALKPLPGTHVVGSEEVGELTARAAREGFAGLNPVQILVVVLVCLLAVGAPFAQLALPPEAQSVLSDEYGTLGLGLAITTMIIQNRKR